MTKVLRRLSYTHTSLARGNEELSRDATYFQMDTLKYVIPIGRPCGLPLRASKVCNGLFHSRPLSPFPSFQRLVSSQSYTPFETKHALCRKYLR